MQPANKVLRDVVCDDGEEDSEEAFGLRGVDIDEDELTEDGVDINRNEKIPL